MPHTYTTLLYHCVFGTKGRRAAIKRGWRGRLHRYIGGIARTELGRAIKIGGTDDHIHILISLKPTVTVADSLRDLKSKSSGWVHKTIPAAATFGWQDGYGAFTVSRSQVKRLISYIENQARHHETMTFEEEFRRLLERHGVTFDPDRLWDDPGAPVAPSGAL